MPTYTILNSDGNSIIFTPTDLHLWVLDNRGTQDFHQIPAIELVKVCQSPLFPSFIAKSILISILFCFSQELLSNGIHAIDNDQIAVQEAYNLLLNKDFESYVSKQTYLKSFITAVRQDHIGGFHLINKLTEADNQWIDSHLREYFGYQNIDFDLLRSSLELDLMNNK